MSTPISVRKIGNSLGVILPKAEIDALGVTEGDKLFLLRAPDGIRLVPYDPAFAEVVEDARDFMRRHRDAFRELAK